MPILANLPGERILPVPTILITQKYKMQLILAGGLCGPRQGHGREKRRVRDSWPGRYRWNFPRVWVLLNVQGSMRVSIEIPL